MALSNIVGCSGLKGALSKHQELLDFDTISKRPALLRTCNSGKEPVMTNQEGPRVLPA